MGIKQYNFEDVIPEGCLGVTVSFAQFDHESRSFHKDPEFFEFYTMFFIAERAEEYQYIFDVWENNIGNEGFVFEGFILEGTRVQYPLRNMWEVYQMVNGTNDIACNIGLQFLGECISDYMTHEDEPIFSKYMAGLEDCPPPFHFDNRN